MKKHLFTLIILLAFIACSEKKKDFDYFEYSYSDTFSTAFSIQFTQNDTLYLREHWNAEETSDAKKFPRVETNYYALLAKNQEKELSELLHKINFTEVESEYFQDYEDGSTYEIIIKKGALEKTILVHSYSEPKELYVLSKWIYNTKKNLKLTKINKELDFKGFTGIFSPPPPPLINVP